MKQHCESAFKIANYLVKNPLVDKVYYPGLDDHPNHTIAASQSNNLFGGIVSFSLKNDTEEAATKFVTSTRLFKLAESLGGVKSLLCHPATMTHKSIPVEKRHATGIQDSLIRLSVGLEEADDLVNDLHYAFVEVKKLANQTKKVSQ